MRVCLFLTCQLAWSLLLSAAAVQSTRIYVLAELSTEYIMTARYLNRENKKDNFHEVQVLWGLRLTLLCL